MRQAAKFSFAYLLTALISFTAGYFFLPDQLVTDTQYVITALFGVLYFLILPELYWLWVIKIGGKKLWRIVIAFSLSCLAARYTFPGEIAEYFEFIAWLRYPFLAVVVVIELALVFSIVRGLWQARHLNGDPRLGVFDAYKDKKPEHLDLALMFSYEPANWYYGIPYLSRKHPKSLASLNLYSARIWHVLLSIVLLLLISVLSYYVLLRVNEILAIVTSAYFSYGIIMAVANYRVSRHYSVYISRDSLIVNANFLNLLPLKLESISNVRAGDWASSKDDSVLCLGSGERMNIDIELKEPQMYYGIMGVVTESVSRVRLSVTDSAAAVKHLRAQVGLSEQ